MNDAAAEPLSEEQVRILGERHVAIVSTGTGSGGTWCREDGWRWPCLPARLLANLEAAQMKAEQWRASLEAGREIMARLVAEHDAAVQERDALRAVVNVCPQCHGAGNFPDRWVYDQGNVLRPLDCPTCQWVRAAFAALREPASQEPGG